MKRRDFIKHSLIGSGGLLITPALAHLINVSKTNSPTSFNGKIIIVGAGVAGLLTAQLLNENGIDVTILEASDVYGGRIRPLKDFSDFPVELGADQILGKRSALYRLFKNPKSELVQDNGQNYYSLDGYLNTDNQLADDADYNQALALAETFADYSGPDITVEQFAKQQGLSKRVYHIYNGLVGNKNGSSLGRLSMLGLKEKENKWTSGYENFFLKNQSLLSIFEEKCSSILGKIKLNTPVVSIDYSADSITVTDKSGGTYIADKIIITVPISILKSSDIKFNPSLPEEKETAFSKIGMGAGMKIVMKFSKRFWKDDVSRIIGPEYVPIFYVPGLGRSNFNNVLTAYINGENAEHLSFEGDETPKIVIKELDKIFGSTSASRSLIGTYTMDWSKQPYIRGSFSYPLVGAANARDLISQPVNDKLFFAGEAMNDGHYGTVQGAMESAQKAVDAILKG